MKKPLIVGITGGIGGGKSTIARALRKKGHYVYDTDKEAKRLQNEHPEIRQQLTELFGQEIYKNNKLDRKMLAGIVFSRPDMLAKLNNIVHPVVRKDFQEWQKKFPDEKYLFIESAILFEGGLKSYVDKIVVVTAPEDVRIIRVVKRDKVTPEQVRERIQNQLPEEEKIKQADIVLDSNGNRIIDKNIHKLFSELDT